ncbi:MAG: putative lipid II flippase FtsW [Candidatus Omnitrophota bacterium]
MRRIRIILFLSTVALLSLGLVMIYSASAIYAWERLGDANYYLKRQVLYLGLGVVFAFGAMAFDYRRLRRHARPLFMFCLGLMVLVLFFGREVFGARRWLRLGGVGFQPSELMYLAFVIYLADFIARKKNVISNIAKGLIPPVILLLVVCFLLLMQPDLGGAVSLSAVVFIMLFVAGVSLSGIGAFILASLPMLYFLVFRVPYRRMRILSFLDPWQDAHGAGFQVIQSQIALGTGGLWGVGLGQSRQKLFYLPAAHTDFIFSIIGEELGLCGAMFVLALFATFIYCAVSIFRSAPDNFGKFLVLGIFSTIALKAVINIGASLGVLPTKGLPLPFVSYGGTSLVSDMISAGLLLNVSRASIK